VSSSFKASLVSASSLRSVSGAARPESEGWARAKRGGYEWLQPANCGHSVFQSAFREAVIREISDRILGYHVLRAAPAVEDCRQWRGPFNQTRNSVQRWLRDEPHTYCGISPPGQWESSGSQRALPVSSATRVSVAIQFTSHVLPPSSENACSKRHEFAVTSDMTNRTKIARPLNVS
jgi:hypothetical protein